MDLTAFFWLAFPALAAGFAGAGYGVLGMTPPYYNLARGFFLIAAAWFAACAFLFRVTVTVPDWGKTLGLILLLLSAIALAYGSHVWINKVQARAEVTQTAPDIVLLPPNRTYTLVWDAPYEMAIVLWPDTVPNQPDQTSGLFPAFRIKNLGTAVAHNLIIQWSVKTQDFDSVVTNSPLVREFFGTIASGYFTVWSAADHRNATMWSERFSAIGESEIAYLAPVIDNTSSIELLLPHDVSAWCDIYFAAKMAGMPMMAAINLDIFASVSWQRPASKPVDFKITAKATNIRSPNAMVEVAGSGEYRPEPRIRAFVSYNVEAA